MCILYGNDRDTKTITLIDLIENAAKRFPQNEALRFGNESLNYEEMVARTTDLAAYLQDLGVKRETLVGIYMDRSEKMIVSILAVIKAGGAYVPLDPMHPAKRNMSIIEQVGINVVLTETKYKDVFAQVDNAICVDGIWNDLGKRGLCCEKLLEGGSQLSYVIFTSGSTGNPKGVQIEHEGIVNYILSVSERLELDSTTRGVSVVTITFDVSLSEIFPPLINGGLLIVADQQTTKDGTKLLELFKNEKVNYCSFTPSTAYMLLETDSVDLTGMKMMLGGEPWGIKLAHKLLDSGCEQLWNVYGPTETTIYSTMTRLTKADSTVSIGLPIEQTSIYVLDDQMNPVEIGQEGTLYIGGIGLARGYYNNPELTSEKFIEDPIDPSKGRIYSTGDIVKYSGPDQIIYVGRSDFQVKVHGYRIELGEIEVALEKLSEVEQAVVVVSGQDETACICAFLKTEGGKQLPVDDVRRHCENLLPYYMVPSIYSFVEDYPKTANYKVDRKKLMTMVKTNSQSKTEYVGPRNEIEEEIQSIWKELLDMDQISVVDDFFEIGGHSLLANRMVNRLNKAFGSTISIAEIFTNKITIEEMAVLVEENILSGLSEEELEALLGEEQE